MNRETWDVERFNEVNLPEVLGAILNKEQFSNQDEPIRVLDLPVFMPGQGMRIPEYLPDPFRSIIMQVFFHERLEYDDFSHYIYVTIDQKFVEAGKTGRRAGAHSDAYIERNNKQIDVTEDSYDEISNEEGEISHTYIAYDCLPTEFFNAKFPLRDTSCEGSLKTFDEIAEGSEVITFPPHAILKMTPYVVHRAAISLQSQHRTFMKVSVSRKKYARKGNTHNHLFDYNWELTDRDSQSRNHPW